jgi:peptide/nickel transport system permease protein
VATRLDTFVGGVGRAGVLDGRPPAFRGVFGGDRRIVSRIADTIMAFPLFVLAMGLRRRLATPRNIIIA